MFTAAAATCDKARFTTDSAEADRMSRDLSPARICCFVSAKRSSLRHADTAFCISDRAGEMVMENKKGI